jgi:predicted lactoylglutathione lyase
MNVISFVMVGTNDLKKASAFYAKVLATINLKLFAESEKYHSFSHEDEPDRKIFYVTNPNDGKPATIGNGTMIALETDTKEKVDEFYKTALANGAKDEGPPGVRGDGNYYAYIRDLDGNKLTVRTILK